MDKVTSKDGTSIAFDRAGNGSPVIPVGGAFSHRRFPGSAQLAELLAELLAPRFTVIGYDRRGWGGSGDTAPYAVGREIEDLEAIVEVGPLSIRGSPERPPGAKRRRPRRPTTEGGTTVRFLVMHKSNEENEAGVPPSREVVEGVGKLMAESARDGVLISAEGVHPSSKGARLSFSGGKRTVTDGPFAEAKELIAGFVVIRAESKEAAIEWATRLADALGDDADIEVRQVVELSDFPPENAPPEAVARDRALREELRRGAEEPNR